MKSLSENQTGQTHQFDNNLVPSLSAVKCLCIFVQFQSDLYISWLSKLAAESCYVKQLRQLPDVAVAVTVTLGVTAVVVVAGAVP